MRTVILAAVLLAVGVTAAHAASAPRIYHRNPQDCADNKLNPLFMADWWFDLNAAQAEHRIDGTRAEAIQKRMLELVNDLAMHNADSNPTLLVDFCRKLNVLRPHWSQWQ